MEALPTCQFTSALRVTCEGGLPPCRGRWQIMFSLQTLKTLSFHQAPPHPPQYTYPCGLPNFSCFCMDQGGLDSYGSSSSQMWALEAGEDSPDSGNKQDWYQRGVSYWEGVEASINGVLGGYGQVNERDVRASEEFLMESLSQLLETSQPTRRLVALDCGAGVGRVTKNLLIRHFHEVDIVEPVSRFLDAAKAQLKNTINSEDGCHRNVNFYCASLQDFTPEVSRYDVIWVQWCIGHLTDQDVLAFFKRAKMGLKLGGIIVLKENVAKNGFVVDKRDSSVTRSDAYFRNLFQEGGLHLYKTKVQKGFPKELFAVRMYALTAQPIKLPPVAHHTRGRRTLNQPRTIF